MATSSLTINRIAEATAVARPTVFRVARSLRETDPDLFPHDPVGRNKATENTPPHILNLSIGISVADPITAAPALVRAYRQAAHVQPIEEVLGEVPIRAPILPGQNLGLDLESLIHLLAKPSAKERNIRQAFDGDFRVTLVVGEALVATVERPSLGYVDYYDAKPWRSDRGAPRPSIVIQGRSRPIVPLRRLVHLDFSHFEVAAELWADSLKHGAAYHPSLLDPSDDGPDENAALPGAASTRDQDQNSIPGPSNIPKGKREKRKTQASSSRGFGHPIHHERETLYDRESRQPSFDQISAA